MKKVVGVLLMLVFVAWGTYRAVAVVQFDRNCGGRLKRAGAANTVELAKSELEVVVKYLEDHQMTEGFTSIFYTTPDEELGFWYTNIKASLAELMKVGPETSQLVRTNVLIKLNETLLDQGSSGASVRVPTGISVHPNNKTVCFLGFLALILAVIGVVLWFL